MRRLGSTIALVVVLAGLGAYIYFVDSKRPASGIEEKQKVFAVEADKIEEITVTSAGETSTLRKVDGAWKMTAPVQADADQSEISSLTSNLASMEINRIVDENPSNLAEFGLAPPKIEVSFKGANGVAGQVRLGEKTATQSDVYAMKPGETRVFVVSAYQESTFAKKAFDLRDKRILNFERDKVDAVEIAQAAAAPIQLARAGSEWVVKSPAPARGDYSAIEGLMTKLSTANMTRLVETAPNGAATIPPDTLAKYGLDKPTATVTLGAGSARATLALGKEEEGAVYARDQARGMVFAVDPTLATDIKKPADDYRDKDLFEFRAFTAARLRIARGSETYEFQRVPGSGEGASEKWQRVAAGGAATDVDQTKMDDLLTKLTTLRAQSFTTTLQGTGLDKPAVVVAVSYDQGKFERVRMAKLNADASASRDGESGTAKLDAKAYDDMVAALDALVAPAPPTASAPGGTAPGNATPGNTPPPS